MVPLKFILILCFALTLLSPTTLYAGLATSNNSSSETDSSESILYSFFDLRERETYLQLTNIDAVSALVHIQIFNVNDNCNENNFFDTYTGKKFFPVKFSHLSNNITKKVGFVSIDFK